MSRSMPHGHSVSIVDDFIRTSIGTALFLKKKMCELRGEKKDNLQSLENFIFN